MTARGARAKIDKEARRELFPLRGDDYIVVCDGAPTSDDRFSVRILINGILTADDAKKTALWLRRLVTDRMPQKFRTYRGRGEVRDGN